jgi:hypothetical protein
MVASALYDALSEAARVLRPDERLLLRRTAPDAVDAGAGSARPEALISLTRSNYMGLVVDAMVERMQVEGFRIGKSDTSDKPTWDIWQANNMDSGSDQLLLEAAIGGKAYALVAPNPARPDRPLIYPEHPSQCIVAYEPGTGRRDPLRRPQGVAGRLDRRLHGHAVPRWPIFKWLYKQTEKSGLASRHPQAPI